MPGGMNQAAMMKQAQKMQQELLRMQQEQENMTFTAKAGGGMVSATVNGKHELTDLQINPEAVATVCAKPAPVSAKYWIWTLSGPSIRTNPGMKA